MERATAGVETVRELAAHILVLDAGRIGTHYAGCWKRHVTCFAVIVRDQLEEA